MIRYLAFLVAVFILSSVAPVLAAEPGKGIIEGVVVNGTMGNSSIPDQEVTLTTYLNNNEVDSASTKTDAEGYFIFKGLLTDTGYSYQAKLIYQEAEYPSDRLTFADGETNKFVEIVAYNSTTSSDAIRIMMSHLIIYPEQDSLRVTEYYLFVNTANLTYIGSVEIPAIGKKETLRFTLPKGATGLELGLGLMECCIYHQEDGFAATMPVLPGSREIAYSYWVNYKGGSYSLAKKIEFPIYEFELLVQGGNVTVTSDRLMAKEPIDIRGTVFSHYSGSDFSPGDTFTIQLSGLQTGSQRGIKWVILMVVVLTGGFGLVALMRKRKLQPVSAEESLNQIRQRLLIELAHLDDSFEQGKISEVDYRKWRAEKKSCLVALIEKAKDNGASR